MLKFAVNFVILVLGLTLAALPARAADDSKVKGLWIEIPGLPEASDSSFNVQSGGEGEAYFERIMDSRSLKISVERISSENRDGDILLPSDTGELTVRLELLRENQEISLDDIEITESVDELAKIYTYPVSAAVYTTKDYEITRGNQDIFIFTDQWIFRIHFSINAERIDDYDAEQMKSWFENMKLVERNSEAEEPSEAETFSGQSIELSASESDLSQAPDIIVEGDPPNLGGWHGNNAVLFNIDLEKAGSYSITLIYSKEESSGDTEQFRITAKNDEAGTSESNYYDIPATGNDWSNYETLQLDKAIRLESGKSALRLESLSPSAGKYVMNLRTVILKPENQED
jgi:hypothetical protein